MQNLGGYSQEKLNEIWDSIGSDKPFPTAEKIIGDDTEQVMAINEGISKIFVSREIGKEWGQWHDTRSVNDSNDFA